MGPGWGRDARMELGCADRTGMRDRTGMLGWNRDGTGMLEWNRDAGMEPGCAAGARQVRPLRLSPFFPPTQALGTRLTHPPNRCRSQWGRNWRKFSLSRGAFSGIQQHFPSPWAEPWGSMRMAGKAARLSYENQTGGSHCISQLQIPRFRAGFMAMDNSALPFPQGAHPWLWLHTRCGPELRIRHCLLIQVQTPCTNKEATDRMFKRQLLFPFFADLIQPWKNTQSQTCATRAYK